MVEGLWTSKGLHPIRTPTEAQMKAHYEFGAVSQLANTLGIDVTKAQTFRAKVRQALRELGVDEQRALGLLD